MPNTACFRIFKCIKNIALKSDFNNREIFIQILIKILIMDYFGKILEPSLFQNFQMYQKYCVILEFS